MTITRTVYIRCDGSSDGECDEEVHIQPLRRSRSVTGAAREMTDRAQVRAKAKAAGWQLTQGLDLCPLHRTDTLIHLDLS